MRTLREWNKIDDNSKENIETNQSAFLPMQIQSKSIDSSENKEYVVTTKSFIIFI